MLAFVAILAISSIGLSRHLERVDAELSSKLFPINADAGINRTLAVLSRQPSREELKTSETLVRDLLRTHAADARLYSLLGEIRRLSGSQAEAYQAFDHAQTLMETEVYSLQWALRRAIDDGKMLEAVDKLDILLRRWPKFVNQTAANLPTVFASQTNYALLLKRLESRPPWRSALVTELASNSGSIEFATRLLSDLSETASPPTDIELGNVLRRLMTAKKFELAFETFQRSLRPEERASASKVYNGSFLNQSAGHPFDWAIRKHPGVTITRLREATGSERGGLRLTFANAPVRNLAISQYVRLGVGTHQLEYRVSAANARMPKGLVWRVVCVGAGKVVGESAVDDGTYEERPATAAVTVPAADCPLQMLQLVTKAIGENWNDRYSGTVIFNDLRVTQTSS